MSKLQSTALGHFQGFVKSFLGCSTGRWAILQLLCSQARRKLKEELFKKINRTSRNNLMPAAVCERVNCPKLTIGKLLSDVIIQTDPFAQSHSW